MRYVRLYTGPGGMEMIEEVFERSFGFTRVYIGKKVMRILRKTGAIKKSHLSGRYYRLIKLKDEK